MSRTPSHQGRSLPALALAVAALSTLPAAIGFGWQDTPLGFGEVAFSIEDFGIAGAAMGALAMAVAVSALRANRRDHEPVWVAGSAIAVSVAAMVAGLVLPVSLLCYFENTGTC